MLHFSLGGGKDYFLASRDRGRQADALPPNACKIGRETVEVILAPPFKWMVMTLGAFQPNAQEKLAHHGCDLVRLSAIAKDRGRTVAKRAALGGEQFMRELVHRLVLAE